MSPFPLLEYTSEIMDMQSTSRGKNMQSLDPRLEILESFNNLLLEGDKHFESKEGYDARSSLDIPKLFSVWRPTSSNTIIRMILGEGTGKGLDIKGKSALSGVGGNERQKSEGFPPF